MPGAILVLVGLRILFIMDEMLYELGKPEKQTYKEQVFITPISKQKQDG